MIGEIEEPLALREQLPRQSLLLGEGEALGREADAIEEAEARCRGLDPRCFDKRMIDQRVERAVMARARKPVKPTKSGMPSRLRPVPNQKGSGPIAVKSGPCLSLKSIRGNTLASIS